MTIMEYCNTYGILKYCSIKDHLRMQQRARLCAGTGDVTSSKLLMHFAILVRALHSSCSMCRGREPIWDS